MGNVVLVIRCEKCCFGMTSIVDSDQFQRLSNLVLH